MAVLERLLGPSKRASKGEPRGRTQVELTAQYANNEMKRLRNDHDQAIGSMAENMNRPATRLTSRPLGRWNDTIRDLSKEFHDFQKAESKGRRHAFGVGGHESEPPAASEPGAGCPGGLTFIAKVDEDPLKALKSPRFEAFGAPKPRASCRQRSGTRCHQLLPGLS